MSDRDYGTHHYGSDRYDTNRDAEGSHGGLGDRLDDVRQRAAEAGSDARQQARRAGRGFDSFFNDHPLVVGVGAFVLGAAIGLSLPSSRSEDRWMGEASDSVKERAKATVGQVADVAQASVKQAAETAKREFNERGLNVEGIKEGVQDAARQAKEAAETTAKEARAAGEKEAKRKEEG